MQEWLGRRGAIAIAAIGAVFTAALGWAVRSGPGALVAYIAVAVQALAWAIAAYAVGATSAARRRTAELERLDAVTAVPNLRAFYEQAATEIARAKRYTHPFTAIYVDLVGFHDVNERLGHSAGDEILCAIAHAIRSNLRATDLLARVGGDEFVVLLPETSAAPARLVLQKMQEAIARVGFPDGPTLTSSMGAATYFTPPTDADALLKQAAALMALARKAGENAVEHRTFN